MGKVTITYTKYNGCQEATDFSRMCSGLNYIACVICALFTAALLLGLGSVYITTIQEGKAFSSLREMLLIFLICVGVLLVDFVFFILIPALIEIHCWNLVADSQKNREARQPGLLDTNVEKAKKMELSFLKKTAIKYVTWTLPIVFGGLCTLHFMFPFPKDNQMEAGFCIAGILLSIVVFVRARMMERSAA